MAARGWTMDDLTPFMRKEKEENEWINRKNEFMMDRLIEALAKEGMKLEDGKNVAVSEEGIKRVMSKYGLEDNLEELVNKRMLRRIKTGDSIIFYLIQPPPSVKQKRKLEDSKENLDESKVSERELELERENQQLQETLNMIDHTQMYKEYIDLLHDYNELKDVVQALLGRLAVMRNMTTRELYPEFDLDPKD